MFQYRREATKQDVTHWQLLCSKMMLGGVEGGTGCSADMRDGRVMGGGWF